MDEKIMKILIGIFGLISMIFVSPLLSPILIACCLLKILSYMCSVVRYGRSVTIASGMDVVNGKESELSRPYINIAFRFKNAAPNIENFRERFEKKVLEIQNEKEKFVFRKFKMIFQRSFGYYIWRDAKNFDIANHITEIDFTDLNLNYEVLQNDKNKIIYEKNKCEKKHEKNDWEKLVQFILPKINSKNNEKKQELPKWNIYVLNEAFDSYTMIFQYHHSITDGMHFLRLAVECLADEQIHFSVPLRVRPDSWIHRLVENLISFSFLPQGLYKILSSNDLNPLHGPRLTGKKIYLVCEKFHISELRRVKKRMNATINDIIFSCVTSAVHKFFTKKNHWERYINVLLALNLQQKKKSIKLKNNFAVVNIHMPISVLGTEKAILNTNKENKAFSFPENTSLKRLQCVKSKIDEAKNDPSIISISWLIKSLSAVLPSRLAETMLSTEGITMDISNVKGPQVEVKYFDSELQDTAFWLSDRDPMGIAVSVCSYKGNFRIGLTVDTALMNETEGIEFLEDCRKEVFSLKKEISDLKIENMPTSEISTSLLRDIP